MLAHTGHVMTLANSIIGVGILAMPFCFQKCGIILSVVLLVISNWITRICCHYLIKASLLTRRKSYELLGFHAFGFSGKLLVELCIIGYLLGTCITYFVVVGDLGPQIITKLFALDNSHAHLRTWVMITVTVLCILPLGMLKNVDSLSAVFTISIGFYVCLVIKIILESENHIVANDWTEKVVYWEPAGVLQCLPIFSMALSCQMQLFEVFESINNQSLDKLNSIVRNATWICTFVYIAVGFFGYVAFCTQPFSGNILINFSPSFGSDVIKIGFILSVAFSFPLVVFPCRASIYSLLYRKGHIDASAYIPEARFKLITVFIVFFSLCIALMIPSVELIIGLVGSTIGVAICVMFPASCFRKIVRKESTERILAQFIVISGFGLMILGTYANLNAIDIQSSGAHLQAQTNLESNVLNVIPTQAPVLKEEDKLDLLEQKMKKAEEAYKKDLQKEPQLTKVLLNAPAKPVAPQDAAGVDAHVQPVGDMAATSPPAPPLPVDENHEAAKEIEVKKLADKLPDKLQVISPEPEAVKVLQEDIKIVPLKNVTAEKLVADAKGEEYKLVQYKEAGKAADKEPKETKDIKENIAPAQEIPEQKLPQPPQKQIIKESLPAEQPQQQQIDKDAIKKDEEVAAEETNKETKSNLEELKKTQKELKKTQDLLERTVDELREELAKQNKETQNLVVEKLGEVVEKVEKIERKVQQNEPQQVLKEQADFHKIAAAPSPAVPLGPSPAEPAPSLHAGSLLSRLAESAKNATKAEVKAPPKPGEVYEPLSYKTGELLEHAKNGTELEQRLPLPLAMLFNASQFQLNEETKDKVKESVAENVHPAPINPKSEVRREVAATDPPAAKNTVAQQNIPQTQAQNDKDMKKEPAEAVLTQRTKRASGLDQQYDFEILQQKLQQANCLHEPKVETLLAHGQSNALGMKMHGITADLTDTIKKKESK